ncbi:uncharacterized protein BT62DRAFT_578350 [Guyanagaster necrorhizus]|uniref:Uncharacterized protein n=1 Tax=Guyanagaster necrorhizus TaxID=856835 RepID=A0A9P7VHE1_9AGAR|nr:uncharacterized protein BT62DRAFT_578350 [Guyanagaster necrorhizus MCA 3950]KAG7440618.1 hypothetical protein BT62DRAFT_578350 [Guyanagaster necrorhizus MCA 3950]
MLPFIIPFLLKLQPVARKFPLYVELKIQFGDDPPLFFHCLIFLCMVAIVCPSRMQNLSSIFGPPIDEKSTSHRIRHSLVIQTIMIHRFLKP